MVGSSLFGVMADRIGRRHTIVITLLCCALGKEWLKATLMMYISVSIIKATCSDAWWPRPGATAWPGCWPALGASAPRSQPSPWLWRSSGWGRRCPSCPGSLCPPYWPTLPQSPQLSERLCPLWSVMMMMLLITLYSPVSGGLRANRLAGVPGSISLYYRPDIYSLVLAPWVAEVILTIHIKWDKRMRMNNLNLFLKVADCKRKDRNSLGHT